MTQALRVFRRAAYLSMYEYFGLYDPRAYVLTWIPRVVLETLFIGLVADFLGGRDLLLFALVGFAGYRTLHSTVAFTSTSVTGELFAGTIPLLVGSPTSPILVFTGRNLAWMFHGLTTGALTIMVAGVLGLPLTLASAVGALIALASIEFSAYALGVFVGSVLLRFPGVGLMVSNLLGFTLFAIAGVTTPLTSLPPAIQTVALAAPLSHGLLALRELLARGDTATYLSLLLQELAIGLIYLTFAMLSFEFFLRQARRRGTLDYH